MAGRGIEPNRVLFVHSIHRSGVRVLVDTEAGSEFAEIVVDGSTDTSGQKMLTMNSVLRNADATPTTTEAKGAEAEEKLDQSHGDDSPAPLRSPGTIATGVDHRTSVDGSGKHHVSRWQII